MRLRNASLTGTDLRVFWSVETHTISPVARRSSPAPLAKIANASVINDARLSRYVHNLNFFVESDWRFVFDNRPYSVKVNSSSRYLSVVIVADRTEILRDRCFKVCKIVRVEHDGLGVYLRISNAKRMMKPEIFAQPAFSSASSPAAFQSIRFFSPPLRFAEPLGCSLPRTGLHRGHSLITPLLQRISSEIPRYRQYLLQEFAAITAT
jgi:hypothetical protein